MSILYGGLQYQFENLPEFSRTITKCRRTLFCASTQIFKTQISLVIVIWWQLNNSYFPPSLVKQPATGKPTIIFWIPGHSPFSFLIWDKISEKAKISISKKQNIVLFWWSEVLTALFMRFFHLLKCGTIYVFVWLRFPVVSLEVFTDLILPAPL